MIKLKQQKNQEVKSHYFRMVTRMNENKFRETERHYSQIANDELYRRAVENIKNCGVLLKILEDGHLHEETKNRTMQSLLKSSADVSNYLAMIESNLLA